jgi:hypothetical protein
MLRQWRLQGESCVIRYAKMNSVTSPRVGLPETLPEAATTKKGDLSSLEPKTRERCSGRYRCGKYLERTGLSD